MLLPLLLIVLATGAAGIIAYGTHPGLTHYARGLEMIMLTRRLEWPIITVCLILCMALLGLVIANKKRAWWLIGLAPVLALFIHHFAPPVGQRAYILDSPQFVDPTPETAPKDEAWVVGVIFEDQAYAVPFSNLYSTPVVFITNYDKRMALMWSARANHAAAFRIARELKSRDLEIVSRPADTLLIYDSRLGQFIIALTGKTAQGERPVGLGPPVETIKTTWSVWKKTHPGTKLLRGYEAPGAPTGPILPTQAGQTIDGAPAETRIAVIDTTPPCAIAIDTVGKQLVNTSSGNTRLLVLRDPVTLRLRAFDRNVKEDLFPKFNLKSSRQHPDAIMTDSDTNSWWTLDGKADAGPLEGWKLKELPVEEDLYWGVMKFWYPGLAMAK